MLDIKNLKYNNDGLIPAIIQDYQSKEVLMLAYMNQESLEKTLESKTTWFWSRSRGGLWNKGKTSGSYQTVQDLSYDCDGDALLIQVYQEGNACHTGEYSCFFNKLIKGEIPQGYKILDRLYEIITKRKENPREGSYTCYLFEMGIDKILKKLGEEATEVIIASKNPNKDELIYEGADLIYHLLVLLNQKEIGLEEIYNELEKRMGRLKSENK
ncbi:bifunctional phosphoribosyl-AMP cyclohydrolase/phosphoribosyl-ATP diphosphatase HisIE [Alkaliphilus serpentinus]|uniref:Histidine biosynthesis bifunctional protein HisIE n=1 Tax=Alkaliphilus serpentinus TaxID=1482731 RepID=A0A833HR33_9FIRM|nr:bifunctional phosphoribosyl-AMP cyclohydrolase/phosphoribosyl-ATP diphosphatase HisIE [Alkaliphilus serpentinus]KAB3532716.1 bifunctional phosphoribosyl-AMP cyclohydrolase/phosphoribosyl-ATP diphosphatase HisIE [Alkaliphilus serpentinus]